MIYTFLNVIVAFLTGAAIYALGYWQKKRSNEDRDTNLQDQLRFYADLTAQLTALVTAIVGTHDKSVAEEEKEEEAKDDGEAAGGIQE